MSSLIIRYSGPAYINNYVGRIVIYSHDLMQRNVRVYIYSVYSVQNKSCNGIYYERS